MKSLFEMISKKAEWVEFDTAPPHDEVGCYITIDNIESLINEVISQRLGDDSLVAIIRKCISMGEYDIGMQDSYTDEQCLSAAKKILNIES